MKIVVLSQAMTPQYGGSAVSEASLCTALQKRFATDVLVRRGAVDAAFIGDFGLTGVKEYDPFEVVKALRDPSHWLARTIDGATLVHINGHWRWENALFAKLCKARGVPYVIQPRGMLWVGHRKIWAKRLFNRVLGTRLVRGASRLIALSEFETQSWRRYGVPKARYQILPNGISPFAKKALNPLPERPFFLYFGRLEKRKNLGVLLAAFDQYVRDQGRADLLLMGPVERHYDRVVEKEIRKRGLETRARIVAPVYGEAKRAYLKQAIAVVYPAYGEPFGRVPFETLMAGGIPIVPRESGSAEYLGRFLGPCTYAIEDAHALVACLRGVEQGSIPDLQVRRQNAQAWVESELSWDKVVERVLDVYREVANESALSNLQELGGVENDATTSVLQRPLQE